MLYCTVDDVKPQISSLLSRAGSSWTHEISSWLGTYRSCFAFRSHETDTQSVNLACLFIAWHLRCCLIWWTVKDVRAQRHSTQVSGTPYVMILISPIYLRNISGLWSLQGVCSFSFSFFQETRAFRKKQKWMFRKKFWPQLPLLIYHAAEVNGNWTRSAQHKITVLSIWKDFCPYYQKESWTYI